jgi:hypothetical protein
MLQLGCTKDKELIRTANTISNGAGGDGLSALIPGFVAQPHCPCILSDDHLSAIVDYDDHSVSTFRKKKARVEL